MAAGGWHPTSRVLSMCPCSSSGGSCLLRQLKHSGPSFTPRCKHLHAFHDGAAGSRAMPTCGGCSEERPRTEFSARQLKNGTDRRRCKHCVPPDGIESNTQQVKRGRPPKAAEELAVQRKTWRFIIEGVTSNEWRAKAAECCYVKKLAFRSIPASGEAPARIEGFVGLSADKSARQLEEELGPAHWDHAAGSECGHRSRPTSVSRLCCRQRMQTAWCDVEFHVICECSRTGFPGTRPTWSNSRLSRRPLRRAGSTPRGG